MGSRKGFRIFLQKGINQAVDGIEEDENNYSIFSVSSSEDSFVYSQPEPD